MVGTEHLPLSQLYGYFAAIELCVCTSTGHRARYLELDIDLDIQLDGFRLERESA